MKIPKPGDGLRTAMRQRDDAWYRLARIAEIIETVDNRCMAADGPVTKTRMEMTDEEMRTIYRLAGAE